MSMNYIFQQSDVVVTFSNKKDMKKDMCEVLEYLKEVLGDRVMDEDDCAIAHLYKKYLDKGE